MVELQHFIPYRVKMWQNVKKLWPKGTILRTYVPEREEYGGVERNLDNQRCIAFALPIQAFSLAFAFGKALAILRVLMTASCCATAIALARSASSIESRRFCLI